MFHWFNKSSNAKKPTLELEVDSLADAAQAIARATSDGAKLSKATVQAIKELSTQGDTATLVYKVYADDLNTIIMTNEAAYGMNLMKETGLLALLLPELAANDGVKQGGLHHLDVLGHSFEALRQLIIHQPEADLALRWATLLHDTGKALTFALDDFGRPSFYNHHQVGDEQARVLLERFGMPEVMIHKACQLIHYHMMNLPQTTKEAQRFARKRRDLLPDLLYLMLADREAARGRRANEASRVNYRLAIARVIEALQIKPELAPKPLLNGEDVLRILKLEEGPKIGRAVRFLQEAQAVGDIKTPQEAERALLHFAERQGWLVN